MSGNKIVKLYVYRYDHEDIVVETLPAKDWGDFVIVEMDINPDAFDQFAQTLAQYADQMNKRFIVAPRGANIEFYGVCPEEEADPNTVSEQAE